MDSGTPYGHGSRHFAPTGLALSLDRRHWSLAAGLPAKGTEIRGVASGHSPRTDGKVCLGNIRWRQGVGGSLDRVGQVMGSQGLAIGFFQVHQSWGLSFAGGGSDFPNCAKTVPIDAHPRRSAMKPDLVFKMILADKNSQGIPADKSALPGEMGSTGWLCGEWRTNCTFTMLATSAIMDAGSGGTSGVCTRTSMPHPVKPNAMSVILEHGTLRLVVPGHEPLSQWRWKALATT